MDDPAKRSELPSREEFYSELSEQGISEADYAHAHKVWDVFRCNNLDDYHDIYLKSDVLSLADVIKTSENICMMTYSLDQAHIYTSPGMS